ncbi:MAG: Crp/Fnr family transcriptional regulator [Huintestinicola sp.]
MELTEKLKGVTLFSGISENDIEHILNCLGCTVRKYPKGSFIFSEQDRLDSIGIILSGSVHMLKEDIWGGKTIIAFLKPTELIGETFVCSSGSPSTVTFYAYEDTEMIFLPFEQLLRTCSNTCVFHHQLVRNMVFALAEKNKRLMEKAEIISKKTLREKILTYLSIRAQEQGQLYFEISFGRQELADYLCADRSALTRELNNMKNEGIIDFDRNTFRIININL